MMNDDLDDIEDDDHAGDYDDDPSVGRWQEVLKRDSMMTMIVLMVTMTMMLIIPLGGVGMTLFDGSQLVRDCGGGFREG